jgi:hypothetical protein
MFAMVSNGAKFKLSQIVDGKRQLLVCSGL